MQARKKQSSFSRQATTRSRQSRPSTLPLLLTHLSKNSFSARLSGPRCASPLSYHSLPKLTLPFLSPFPFHPQTEKLYGHSFELVSVTSASSAPLIATACKATLPEHAVIRLFDTQTWRPVGDVLTGHSLTITKLAFSLGSGGEKSEGNRDRWLLSVGRDRTWRVYEREERGVGASAVSFLTSATSLSRKQR